MRRIRVVCCNRAGFLHVDHGYDHRPEDFEMIEETARGLAALRFSGHYSLNIVTGHSGVARSMYSLSQMYAFNAHVRREYAKREVLFDAAVSCPHHPDYSGPCECRKPKTGLCHKLERILGPINWEESWGIGDKPDDARMILAMGGRAILLTSGPHNNTTGKSYWSEEDPDLQELLQDDRVIVIRPGESFSRAIVGNS